MSIACVLAAHQVVRLERAHGLKDLAFFNLYRTMASRGRRFHGQQRDDLEKVVLDDVAQTAGGFIKRPALRYAEILGQRNLDAGHAVTVPDRLQE